MRLDMQYMQFPLNIAYGPHIAYPRTPANSRVVRHSFTPQTPVQLVPSIATVAQLYREQCL